MTAGQAARLEQAYATADMMGQREELRRSLRASAGESTLDLGSGPGFLAFELADEVGASGRIVGWISSDMNSLASNRVADCGFSHRVEILQGDATALAFADVTFDAAVSMQVIEYVSEPDAALHQLARVLRPGGRIVIVDTDWDSLVWEAENRGRAARIVTAWNEHLPDPYLPRSLAPRLREDEATEWLNDLDALQHQGRYFFSVNRYLFAASRRSAVRRRPLTLAGPSRTLA